MARTTWWPHAMMLRDLNSPTIDNLVFHGGDDPCLFLHTTAGMDFGLLVYVNFLLRCAFLDFFLYVIFPDSDLCCDASFLTCRGIQISIFRFGRSALQSHLTLEWVKLWCPRRGHSFRPYRSFPFDAQSTPNTTQFLFMRSPYCHRRCRSLSLRPG